ncbi:hypothetical protein [Streptomyces sp. NPDC002537]
MTDSLLVDISAAWWRGGRAALFAALCVLLSAGSHVLLSGAPLPVTTVAATSAAVFALAYALAGRERRFAHIAALLVPLELAADAVFTVGQRTCYGADGHPVPGALAALCGGGGLDGPFGPLTDPGTACWLLLAAHLTVGLLAAAWLRRGEAAFVRLLAAAAAAALRPLPPAAAPPAVRPDSAPVRPARPVRAPAPPRLTHSVVRRGPPRRPALA